MADPSYKNLEQSLVQRKPE